MRCSEEFGVIPGKSYGYFSDTNVGGQVSHTGTIQLGVSHDGRLAGYSKYRGKTPMKTAVAKWRGSVSLSAPLRRTEQLAR